MRSKTSMWYEVKYHYEKTLDNGAQKKVTEQYVVEAISFGAAEAAIVSEMAAYVSAGETDVRAVAIAPYSEVLLSNDDKDSKFYKAKVAFITIDEKTGNERKNSRVYLVQAASTSVAEHYIAEHFAPIMTEYEVQRVAETAIMGVFERKKVESSTF